MKLTYHPTTETFTLDNIPPNTTPPFTQFHLNDLLSLLSNLTIFTDAKSNNPLAKLQDMTTLLHRILKNRPLVRQQLSKITNSKSSIEHL